MKKIVFLLLTILFVPHYSNATAVVRVDDVCSMQNRKYFTHTVAKGENVSSILKSYNISLSSFLKANKKFNGTNLALSLGEELIFPKKDIGSSTDTEINHEIRVYMESVTPLIKEGVAPKNVVNQVATVKVVQPQKNDAVVVKREKITLTNSFDGGFAAKDDAINLSLLLPLTKSDGAENREYEEFYKGALVAMDSLKRLGVSLNVDVYDTFRSESVVRELLRDGSLRKKDIIIGPIYNEQFNILANEFKGSNTILVSPLASVDADGENIYQLLPNSNNRYTKLNPLLVSSNVIVLQTPNDDALFVSHIKSNVDKAYLHTIDFNPMIKEENIASFLNKSLNNVIVVGSKNKSDIEIMLSKIVSLKKGVGHGSRISIIGSSEFAKIDDLKKSDFFKANTYYVTSYHQDRLNQKSLAFETKYVDMFGEVPSLYSYRAYDVVMMFVSTLYEAGDEFADTIYDNFFNILQVEYRFLQERDGAKNINQEWMLVNYRPNFTITTK